MRLKTDVPCIISLRNWKSQYIVKEGKAVNFGSHKEKLGVNDSQTSTNSSPVREVTAHSTKHDTLWLKA